MTKIKILLKKVFTKKNIIRLFVWFVGLAFISSFFTNKRRVYISTNIYPLQVYVNGEYKGATPLNLRLKKGSYDINFKYGDIDLKQSKINVRSALFFSWFFEYSENYNYNIEPTGEYIHAVEKNFLQDAVDYSTLYHPDTLSVNKPIWTLYRSAIGADISHVNIPVLNTASNFIANSDMLNDYNNFFNDDVFLILKKDSRLNFFDGTLNGLDEIIQDEIKPLDFKPFEVKKFNLSGINFVSFAPNMAISQDIVGTKLSYNNALVKVAEFSKKSNTYAHIPSVAELKTILNNDDVISSILNSKNVNWEYTSTVFTPQGNTLSDDCIKILNEYGIEPYRRLFIPLNTTEKNIMLRQNYVAPFSPKKEFKNSGFRIVIENYEKSES